MPDARLIKARVLVVSDAEHTRTTLARRIAAMPNNHMVIQAASTQEALANLPGLPPAKVVVCYHTATFDAVECLRAIKLKCPPVGCILLVEDRHYKELVARTTADATYLGIVPRLLGNHERVCELVIHAVNRAEALCGAG